MYVPATEEEKKFIGCVLHFLFNCIEEQDEQEFHETTSQIPGRWPIPDTAHMSARLHKPENKTQLIDNEAYLHGWSDKVFSSDDTRKLWNKAIQKNSLKNKVKEATCLPF